MDYYLGDILLLPFGYSPVGSVECAGQLMQIAQYSALYSLLGTQYGGNGTTNFGIPDLRNAVPNSNMRYCIMITGVYPQRP